MPTITATAPRINSTQMHEAIDLLKEAVSYPSVSDHENSDYSPTALKASAEFFKKQFEDLGFTTRMVKLEAIADPEKPEAPKKEVPDYLIAESPNFDAKIETINVYFHRDVQPIVKEKWKKISDPFKAEIHDGRLYGRGSSDDKGGGIAIIAAIKTYIAARGGLPVNIRVICDGEEEIGSPNMERFLEKEGKNLKGRALVIMDGGNKDDKTGTIAFSTGGLVNIPVQIKPSQKTESKADDKHVVFSLQMRGLKEKPVHSGVGALAPDACLSLGDLAATLKDFPGASVSNFVSGKEKGSNAIQDNATCLVSVPLKEGQDPAQVETKLKEFIAKQNILHKCQLTIDSASDKAEILAPDATLALCHIVSTLKDPGSIPGFMDGCTPLTAEERELLIRNTQTEEEHAKEVGAVKGSVLRGSSKLTIFERVLQTPNTSILNFTSKSDGTANCMVSARIKPGQDPEKIAKVMLDHIRSQKVLNGCEMLAEKKSGSWAWKADLSRPYTNKYLDALKENFDGKVCIQPTSGALPFIIQFEKAVPGTEVIVPGVEDHLTAAHSEDESQNLKLLEAQINTFMSFMYRLDTRA